MEKVREGWRKCEKVRENSSKKPQRVGPARALRGPDDGPGPCDGRALHEAGAVVQERGGDVQRHRAQRQQRDISLLDPKRDTKGPIKGLF